MQLDPEHHLTKCMQCNEVYVCVWRVCEMHSCGQRRSRHRQTEVRPQESPADLSHCIYANIFRSDCHVWITSGQSHAPVGRCGPGPLGSQENIPLWPTQGPFALGHLQGWALSRGLKLLFKSIDSQRPTADLNAKPSPNPIRTNTGCLRPSQRYPRYITFFVCFFLKDPLSVVLARVRLKHVACYKPLDQV